MALFEGPQVDNRIECIVRINSIQTSVGLAGIQSVLDSHSPPPALMLPKVRSPEEIKLLDELLQESSRGTRLNIIRETNAEREADYEIAQASSRIEALFFGGVDMAADLRCQNSWEPLLYARSRVVHAAAAAGIDVIDAPYLNLDDLDGMKREACLAQELGFSGKGAIHPKQISILNQVFTPTEGEVAYAKKICTPMSQPMAAS